MSECEVSVALNIIMALMGLAMFALVVSGIFSWAMVVLFFPPKKADACNQAVKNVE